MIRNYFYLVVLFNLVFSFGKKLFFRELEQIYLFCV